MAPGKFPCKKTEEPWNADAATVPVTGKPIFSFAFSIPLFFAGHNGVVDCLGEQKRPRGIPKKEEEEKKEVREELVVRESFAVVQCSCFIVDPFVSDYLDSSMYLWLGRNSSEISAQMKRNLLSEVKSAKKCSESNGEVTWKNSKLGIINPFKAF